MNTAAFSISRIARTQPAEVHRPDVVDLKRLVLRGPEQQDIGPMTALADDIRVASKAWEMPQPYTISDAGRFLRRVREADGLTVFAIMHRETGGFLGCCKLDTNEDETERQIGFWLGEAYWNRGYMTEALQGLIDHAYSKAPRLARLSADIQVVNPAARRVLEKCGFQYAGPGARRDVRLGCLVPVDRYRMDRGIWMALNAWSRAG
ncbi:GNAT family N-acetyltransferase [Rhizobium sp. TH2]|uniref:GNAT family N-acetyltransferase n=1 Tax=Rhizobium sp. TH2 TaxID=2775403 RepID=UPI0021578ED9|nr:GNAT family N-acetyltransferase [Rhizobium sp. TH2]UVC10145.1 GNAT family N-acetyltransferase [Rhizobium sp. TH2]